jgi:DNA-binding response OmpR family regulator
MNILIVEDNPGAVRFLKQAINEAGYVAQSAEDGHLAFDMAVTGDFDLILLDIMLPGIDGLEVCRRLRAEKVLTPILLLTAKDTLQDKVKGLDCGADDYIVKPFQVAELLARTRALLRRGISHSPLLSIADLTLDPATHKASRNGRVIPLSATEYALLEYFMRNIDRVLTRSMILEHVWQYDFDGRDSVVDVYISYLRSKIDKGHNPTLIHTIRGVGFRMGVDDAF